MQQKLAYTVDEVIQLTGLSRTGLYRAIANNQIASFRPKRRRLFTHAAVTKFLSRLEAMGGSRD